MSTGNSQPPHETDSGASLSNDQDSWLHDLRDASQSLDLGSLGHFDIISEVSRGGQGVVHKAIQKSTGRQIAIKRIRSGQLASQRERWRLNQEAIAAASLKHPGLVTVFDICEINDQPILAMEWIDGLPIDEFVRQNQCTIQQIVELGIQLCSALQHAHGHGVIHRDIKPSNILVAADGTLQIIDFGLAINPTSYLSHEHHTTEGVFLGTLNFAAPERLLSGREMADTRSDVYSLAAVMYSLLAGSPPLLSHKDPASTVDAILKNTPSAPSKNCPRIPREIDLIILKALEKSPDRRYQTAEALEADLHRWNTGLPILAHPPSKLYKLQKFSSRNKTEITLALLISVALTLLTISSVLFAVREREERRRAELAEIDAKTKALNAENIERFLRSVLESARSDLLGRDATIETAVDYSIPLLTEISDSATIGRLNRLLGNIYSDLGRYKDSQHRYRASISIFESIPESAYLVDVLESKIGLSETHNQMKEFDLAIQLSQEIINQAKQLAPHFAVPIIIQTQIQLSHARSMSGSYDEALSDLSDALLTSEQMFGFQDELTLDVRHALGVILLQNSEYELSVDLLKKNYDYRKEKYLVSHPKMISATFALSQSYANSGMLNLAEPLERESYEQRSAVLGDRHPQTLHAMNGYAETLSQLGRHAQAELLFRKCHEIYKEVLGEGHRDTLNAINAVGLSRHRMQDSQGAAEAFRECLNLKSLHLGESHSSTMMTRSNLGRILLDLGQYESAEEMLAQVVSYSTSTHGPNSDSTLRHKAIHALSLSRLGQSSKATELFMAILQSRIEQFGLEHPKSASVMLQISSHYIETKLYPEAITILEQATPIFREHYGDTSQPTILCAWRMFHALKAENRTADAISCLSIARTRYQDAGGLPIPIIASFLLEEGKLYFDKESFLDAEHVWIKHFRLVKTNFKDDPKILKESQKHLDLLYQKWSETNPELAQQHKASNYLPLLDDHQLESSP